MKDSKSSGNVNLNKCVRCGDCATGCNFGAKNSLDVNLLVRAQQAGAEIFSGATVLSIEKDGNSRLDRQLCPYERRHSASATERC